MKNFQLITIVVFIAAAVIGLLVFSGKIPLGSSNAPGGQGTVVLWGTTNSSAMAPLIEEFNAVNTTFVTRYVQKSADTLDQDLLESLASGVGPDMILLPDNLAFHYANKLSSIPYTSYSLATFKANFAGAGEVFLTSRGLLAFPMSVDPLVMYYNRSILDANSIVYPPAFWDDLVKLVPTLTKKDDANKIITSTVALGHYANVTNAKDILATLFMQNGSPIVSEQSGIFSANLVQYNLGSILRFYTAFADPSNNAYSWNRSFPSSSSSFSRETLAFYFGFASELPYLVGRNPNQNFLVATFPQIRNSNFKLTGAHVTGLGILASSKNFNTAFLAASQMATGNFASRFASLQGVAPVRRDLLALKPTDSFLPIFYSSALYAKSWLDPAPLNTNDIFRNMIDGVLSNNFSAESAISDSSNKINILLQRYKMKNIQIFLIITTIILTSFFVSPFILNNKALAIDQLTVSTVQYQVLGPDTFVFKGSYSGNTQKKPLTTYFEFKKNDSNLNDTKNRKETIKIIRNTNVDESNIFFTTPDLQVASTYYFRAVGYFNDSQDQKFYGNILSLQTGPIYVGSLYYNIAVDCSLTGQIRNIITSQCFTPIVCVAPQIRNIITNNCETPTICGDKEVRDIITNKCVASVTCDGTNEFRNIITNKCETVTSCVPQKETRNIITGKCEPVINCEALGQVRNIITSKCEAVVDCSKTNQVRNIITGKCETPLKPLNPTTTPPKAPSQTNPLPPPVTGSLVVCSNTPDENGVVADPCDFNALITLINKVIRFVLFNMAVPISAIMFAYAGFLLVTAGGEGEKTKAKNIFTNTVIGLVIAAGAWLIVETLLAIVSKPGMWSWIGF